jgi:hypothetical protein
VEIGAKLRNRMHAIERNHRAHPANVRGIIVSALVMAVGMPGGTSLFAQGPRADCASPAQCRQLTLEAIAQGDYERAHDLAWRLVQTSPPRDSAAMSLLARAQSLSGRGYDALIMLERLAAAAVIVDEVDTSDDFRRVREYPQWPQLLETISRLRSFGASAVAPSALADKTAGKRVAPPASASAPSELPRDKPPAPTSAASAAPAGKPPAPVAPVAPTSAADAATAGKPVAPVAPILSLPLPNAMPPPVAFAHDAVSARFVTADEASDVLRVVSESAGTATALISPGWSGNARLSALAIAPRTGDLWVAGTLGKKTTIHRLQLISGRLLNTFTFPEDVGEVHVAALVVSPTALFALDSAGRRIFVRGVKSADVRVQASLPRDITPTGLAYAGSSLYVSHAAGVLRIDLTARGQRAVSAAKAFDVTQLRSLAWHDGSLLAIRGDDASATVVRVRLNASGSAVTAIERLDRASGTAAVLSGQTYIYLGSQTGETGLAFRGVPARK